MENIREDKFVWNLLLNFTELLSSISLVVTMAVYLYGTLSMCPNRAWTVFFSKLSLRVSWTVTYLCFFRSINFQEALIIIKVRYHLFGMHYLLSLSRIYYSILNDFNELWKFEIRSTHKRRLHLSGLWTNILCSMKASSIINLLFCSIIFVKSNNNKHTYNIYKNKNSYNSTCYRCSRFFLLIIAI